MWSSSSPEMPTIYAEETDHIRQATVYRYTYQLKEIIFDQESEKPIVMEMLQT